MPTNGYYTTPALTKQQKRAARYVGAIGMMLARANKQKRQ